LLRRVIAYGLVAIIGLSVPAGMLLYVLFKSEPEGYTRPGDFSTEELETQAAEFMKAGSKVANAFLDESNQTPFDVTFTDAMINAQIRINPARLRKLPSWLRNPQVAIGPEGVVLMVDFEHERAQTVLSFHVSAEATADGEVSLRLTKMRAGRLPMPESVLALLTEQASERIAQAEARVRESTKKDKDDALLELCTLKAGRDLIERGEALLDLRECHLRLDGLELLPHAIHLAGRRVDKPAPAGPRS
jgi:hypothetical protein